MDDGRLCPKFEATFALLGRRWVGLIWEVLLSGPKRFGQLHDRIPQVSDRMLAERLRELEAFGIVTRTVVPTVPVQVTYTLTPKGEAFRPVLDAVHKWSDDWIETVIPNHETL
ncbi:MAG: winged helix-turn-helix transcriptional regulator [Sulfobacillus sp.]